jgi:ADP-glucose pyrophosphorylase
MDYMDFVQVSSLFQADALISSLFLTAWQRYAITTVLQKHVDSGADISVACVPMDERSFTFLPYSLLNVFFVLDFN